MSVADSPPGSLDGDDIYLYDGIDDVPYDVCHVRVLPSVTEIPGEAFAMRSELTNVELPEGLQVIRGGAFKNCSNLSKITIPSTVTEIGPFALRRCES